MKNPKQIQFSESGLSRMFTTTSVRGVAGAAAGKLKPAEWLGAGIIPAVHAHQEVHGAQKKRVELERRCKSRCEIQGRKGEELEVKSLRQSGVREEDAGKPVFLTWETPWWCGQQAEGGADSGKVT